MIQPNSKKSREPDKGTKQSTGLFWTAEEDNKLLSLWPIYKKNWEKYVMEFNGRSKVAIRQHLKILLEKQQQVNLGTVISAFVGGIWIKGMVTKIWEGEYEGMVSLSCEGTGEIETYNLDQVKYKVISQPPNRRRRGNRRDVNEKTSQYRGVRWDERQKGWIGSLCHKKTLIHCGVFQDEKKAALAYDKKADELIGKRAALNFPELIFNKRKPDDQFVMAPEENPYLGVTWDKHAKKWKVHVHHNKKVHHCGYFSDLLEAAHMYDQKCIEFKGPNAKKLNFPISAQFQFGSIKNNNNGLKVFIGEPFQFKKDSDDIVPVYIEMPIFN